MEQQFYVAKLISKTMLTQDIMILVFERPQNFNFIPGQFVQFEIPLRSIDAHPETGASCVLRSYSIASHTTNDNLEFCIKILPDGKASDYLLKLPVGGIVRITAAKGAFVCSSQDSTQKVFIATGAGIAPIAPMIESRLNSGDTLYLLFGLRAEKDLFWVERFTQFKQADPRFTFNITLSKPGEAWTGWQGRVTSHLPTVAPTAQYYLCGSLEMVKDVRKILVDQGVNTKSVHFEIF